MCGEEVNTYRVLVGISEGGHHLDDLGLDVMVILKWILRLIKWKGMDLGEALVNIVLNLLFWYKLEIFLAS
jgi:hypothetical protein